MKQVRCEDCLIEYPINDTFKVSGKAVCQACGDKILSDKNLKFRPTVERQLDPTICFNCRKDNGNIDLPALSGLPACEQCQDSFLNRPFPQWIKVAMVGVVVLVIVSFVWNMRFIKAYSQIKTSYRQLSAGEIEKAAASMSAATSNVPEDKYTRAAASFFDGLVLLKQEKWNEAIERFNACGNNLAPVFQSAIEENIAGAKIAMAFDNKDYDGFVRMAMQLQNKKPDDPIYVGQVASAYACKYAQSGDEQFKKISLESLDKARALAKKSAMDKEFEEYEQRILHRLHTREIIDRKEFVQKFPNGWQPPKE
jgi:tetratricopeptide (TPR) repeat protein